MATDESTGQVWLTTQAAEYGVTSPGSISIFDGQSGHLLQTLPVGKGPQDIAIDPQTGLVFVTNEHDGTVNVFTTGSLPTPTPADPVAVAEAQHGARYFLQTQHTLGGAFLAFWQRYGGLDTFGYPRTEPFTETGHLAQYTDRFELEVLTTTVVTAPLGRLLTAGRTFPPVAPFTSTADRLYFASTGHSLSGRFLTFW